MQGKRIYIFSCLKNGGISRGMTGYLRFLLAYLVLLSHVGFRVEGLNPGVFAVVIFYILAGHVVTHLLFDVFWNRRKSIFTFYKDRFLRIFPLYLFVSLITVVFLLSTSFGSPEFKPINVINNLLLIPLNYYMYIYDKLIILTSTNPPWWLIPPAWSLGAEFQIYLLLPFLIRFPLVGIFFFFCSLCVYSAANLNLIHSDYFGYRLIPGVLFIFMMGSIIQKAASGKASNYEKLTLTVTYTFCILWFLYFVVEKHIYGAYTRETLLGIIVGAPIVYMNLKLKLKLPFNRTLGNLSYGVFLSHFLAIWILEYLGFPKKGILFPISVSVITLTIAWVGVTLVDKKVEKIRFNL